MSFELPLDEVDTGSVGGYDRVEPGKYHCIVMALNEDGGKNGEMVVDFEILRGTTANQEGRSHRELFKKDVKSVQIRKFLALAIACGLTTREQIEELKAKGERPMFDWQQCVGKQVCMHLEENEHQGKTYVRLAWDEIWRLDDKRANSIPLHAGFLKTSGIMLPPTRNIDGILSKSQTPPSTLQQKKTTGTEQQAPKPSADEVLAGIV